MSNALIYAIAEISQQIPRELLHSGMMIDEQEYTANLTTIDDKILRKVIRKRVMLDANIIGGIEMVIPLNNVQPSFYEQFYTVYQVPPEYTMNREIISALNLTSMPATGYFGQNATGQLSSSMYNGNVTSGYNSVMNAADRIGNAASSGGVMSNANIEIVGYNTLLVYAHYRMLANFGIRVLIENDSNLNNIQPRSFKNFSYLCVLAVKAYLYIKLNIAINSGYLSGGQELGVFKDVLNSYEGAEEEYRTYLREVWAPTAYMNDVTRYSRYIGSMLTSGL